LCRRPVRLVRALFFLFSIALVGAAAPAHSQEAGADTAVTDACDAKTETLNPSLLADLRGRVNFSTNLLAGGERATLVLYPPPGVEKPRYDSIRVFARLSGQKTAPSLVQTLGTPPATTDVLGTQSQSIWIEAPSNPTASWKSYQLYTVACKSGKAEFVAGTDVDISSRVMAIWLTVGIVIGTYLLVSFVVTRARGIPLTLNPAKWAAVDQGRGSLSVLQMIWFTTVVFALATYYLLRLGTLGELSEDVLSVMGIALVGTIGGVGIDSVKQRLKPENYTWILKRGWIQPPKKEAALDGRLGDIFFEGGRFEPTKYQAVIFSVVVGAALLFTGFDGLATFKVPDAYLILLGGSQLAYLIGKQVAPDRFQEATDLVDAARKAEDDLRTAAATQQAKSLGEAQQKLPVEYARARDAIDFAATRIERLFAVTIASGQRQPNIS
jgi:hypothetical protein